MGSMDDKQSEPPHPAKQPVCMHRIKTLPNKHSFMDLETCAMCFNTNLIQDP